MTKAGTSLSELLLRWYQLRQQGQAVSIARLCADCPHLAGDLQREILAVQSVEVHLSLAGTQVGASTTGPWDGPPPLCPPKASPQGKGASGGPQVAGYRILAEFGRGGMGVVYKAHQLSLKRPVALKMVLGARPRPDQLVRFRVEAESVARLQHPNIIQIFEVGCHEGCPFFSLEYADGGSLAQKLRGGRMGVAEAARLVETLARAVQYAHSRGIVHRDLKPANVLLAGDDTPKVADFGLAKQLDARFVTTKLGAVMGTPSYMAPEQAAGRTTEVGPATDIYALGAILYELLTGRPPFRAATVMDILMGVLCHEPAPPRTLRPDVPVELEAICLKCLRKDPAERYPSAEALAHDLRKVLASLEARQGGPWHRIGAWVKRRPRSTLALGTCAVLCLILAVCWNRAGLPARGGAGGRETAAGAKVPDTSSWTDVLRLVDPGAHSISGVWERQGSDLRVQPGEFSRIAIPLIPAGSYELRVRLTRIQGAGEINIMLPVVGSMCMMSLGRGGEWHGLQRVNGLDHGGQYPGVFTNGTAHTVSITVSVEEGEATIAVDLDGKALIRWQGQQPALTHREEWGISWDSLGLGAHNDEVVFHSVELRMISERATPTGEPKKATETPLNEELKRRAEGLARHNFARLSSRRAAPGSIRTRTGDAARRASAVPPSVRCRVASHH